MPESDQVALYFLFSEEEDGSGRKVYVGQTGDLRARLAKHHKEKEFWEKALVRKRPVKAPVVFCLREARCDFTRRSRKWGRNREGLSGNNWLFAGSARAGVRAAAIQTLLGTARMNGLDPYAWLKDTLEKLPTWPIQ